MGLYDREYFRNPQVTRGIGIMRTWSVTTWLIAINVAVYVLNLILQRLFYNLGYFSVSLAVGELQVWRFITFQFLHASPQHIFFNMLALYFFGPMVEHYLGSKRYLIFYLLCGVAGAVTYLVLIGTLFWSPHWQTDPLVGASAGIFGILIAAATRVAPNTTVMLLFPPIPMKLRTLAWVMIGIAVFTILNHGANAGGEAGHLGGAALGYLLIQRPEILKALTTWPAFKRKGSGWKMDNWR